MLLMTNNTINPNLLDALTGLANRQAWHEYLSNHVKASQPGSAFGLLFIDIDRFTIINALYGYPVGDVVLQAVHSRLQEILPGNFIARTGSDEFAVLVTNTEPMDAAQLVSESFAAPIPVEAIQVLITVSIGIAYYPDHGTTVEQLREAVRNALDQAREQGLNSYQVFDRQYYQGKLDRYQIEEDLRRALKAEEFCAFYQPIAEVATQKVVGFESLARWQHPTLGLLPPARFIPIAEESGLIQPLGCKILKAALTEFSFLNADHPSPFYVSVNMPIQHLQREDFIPMIVSAIRDTNMKPSQMMIEVTESAFCNDLEAASENLKSLHRMGIRVAIDDFGTGFSSFEYLRTFPIDLIKIDRSFVIDICTNPVSANILRSMITIAHQLDAKVIVEGIEDEDQLQLLRDLGCDFFQGYLLTQPKPLNQLSAFTHTPANIS